MKSMDMLKNAVIVAAHPDDEILWMSSILDRVERIVICFQDYPAIPALGKGRRQVLSEYPLDNMTSLAMQEAGVFNCADWGNPRRGRDGLEIRAGQAAMAQYRKNSGILYASLKEMLQGAANVITHNPWGEYGHEEHVQVYQVVSNLQENLGFDLWCSTYFSTRSAPLMALCGEALKGRAETLKTNRALADRLRECYIAAGCWTWPEHYQWPGEETFVQAGQAQGAPASCVAMNLISVELQLGGHNRSTWRRRLASLLKRR